MNKKIFSLEEDKRRKTNNKKIAQDFDFYLNNKTRKFEMIAVD